MLTNVCSFIVPSKAATASVAKENLAITIIVSVGCQGSILSKAENPCNQRTIRNSTVSQKRIKACNVRKHVVTRVNECDHDLE